MVVWSVCERERGVRHTTRTQNKNDNTEDLLATSEHGLGFKIKDYVIGVGV